MKVQVNFHYQASNGKLRSSSILVDAVDLKTAKNKATETLAKEHDWYRITSATDVTLK